MSLIYEKESFAIVGCALEVHKELGPGFLEALYQETLAYEFSQRQIPFQREVFLPVVYKGMPMGARYKADFLVYDDIIVETKAISSLTNADVAQAMHYLRASSRKLGLLLNFGAQSLERRRVIV